MKTMKILVAAVGLFLTVNTSVVLAQEDTERNDSIYGLEASIDNGFLNLSFYSTYGIEDIRCIKFNFYYGENAEDVWEMESQSVIDAQNPTEIVFTNRFGIVSYENIDGIFKININNADLSGISVKKMELYLTGDKGSFLPLPDKLPWISKSNLLTFFFESTVTSLIELKANENYTYKYFLLSGKESKEMPVNVPFIQKKYHNGILISTIRKLEVR